MKIKTFWRDIRFLKILAQVVFLAVLVMVFLYFFGNVSTNLARQGLTVGYGFLRNPASFDIGENYIPYSASMSYGRALLVAFVNTLVVSFLGIIDTAAVRARPAAMAGRPRSTRPTRIATPAGTSAGPVPPPTAATTTATS